MLTEQELAQHRKDVSYPISAKNRASFIKHFKSIKVGDFIYVREEGYDNEIVKVLEIGEPEIARVYVKGFKFIGADGLESRDWLYYHQLIRKATDREVNEQWVKAKMAVKFYQK
jgi:hypothetical protein